MKVRFDGYLSCKIYVYMDNGLVTCHYRDLCWAAGRRFASFCSKGGVEDASRKRTFPSDGPGPYARTVCHTSKGEISGIVSQEKWEKTQSLVRELTVMVQEASVVYEQE